jgi:tRNA wybutosine-synthesizing protein 3
VLGGSGKKEASFLYVTHDVVDKDTLWDALQGVERASLRQEGFIVHVCCKTLEDANKLLAVARESGLKRAAIISAEDRIVVEIVATSQMETLACKGKVLVDRAYVSEWISEAASRLKKNYEMLDGFTDRLGHL